jgi:glutathione S-transferase
VPTSRDDKPQLVTISVSHYCEKARWALDRAGVAYDERRHLPGLHRLAARRAGGRLTVPVLVCPEGEIVRESSEIVAWADARGARVALDADARRLAEGYDEHFGPATRLWVYHNLLKHPNLTQPPLTDGVPGWQRQFFRVGHRGLSRVITMVLNINDETAVDAERTFRATFAEVDALLADGRPYLAGDTFSIADLTFAALSAPVLGPPEYGVRLPTVETLPPAMAATVEEHRATPAGRHALRMFAEERGPVAAVSPA